MLEVLQAMRAVSLHPDAAYSGDIDAYIASSARLAETFRILEEIRAKDGKALIFCEALEMQDFLAEALPRKFGLPGAVGIINGNVPGARRQEMVDRFQSCPEGFDVMVLSPRAGGDGAYLMAFDSERQTVYRIRRRHGNEQVREVVPGDYAGVLVTDRFSSYEAEELRRVQQHQCLAHLLRYIGEAPTFPGPRPR